MAGTMYSVTINGVTIECKTPADAVRLANEVAALNGAAQQPSSPPQTPPPSTQLPSMQPASVPAPMPTAAGSQSVMPGVAGEIQPNKWTERARKVIALLAEAGSEGLAADEVAAAAELGGAKGSSPLLKEIVSLLEVGEGAIKRPRTAEGKRWVLVPKARKAAAKLGLLHAGASRP